MFDFFNDRAEIIQTIVDSIGDAVIACNIEEKIIYYNRSAKLLFWSTISEESLSTWSNNFSFFLEDKVTLFPMEKFPLLLALKGEFTNGIVQFIKNRANAEGRYISVTGSPLFDHNMKIIGAVAVVRDISIQKKSELEIRAANQLLQNKNVELTATNKELESFSYALCHDLKEPLRSIIGFSNILLKNFSCNLNVEGLEYLNRIKNSGNKLAHLIDGFLDLYQLTSSETKRTVVDLSEITKSVVSDLQNQDPERIVFFKIADGVTAIADQRLLRSVMQNLIGNAWKFSSKKQKAQIEFGVIASPSEQMTYFVKDNGAGFNEKYSEKLFNIFQRLHSKEEFDGNGIGLATTKRIIHRHGGIIWAKGKPNEGATFYFTL